MDIMSFDFLQALITIIFIDLVLAGDNAIVIALAARKLPKESQKKVILLGTAGAIIIRAAATVVFVSLLDLPWLMLGGGLVLLWISYKLLVDSGEHDIEAQTSVWAAVRTIIIADAAMGIDNVIAVAGAAQHDGASAFVEYTLVVIGLLISIPIVIWGSTLFIKLTTKYPWIVYAGSGVLAYTAAKMIVHEKIWKETFDENDLLRWGVMVLFVVGIVAAGLLVNARRAKQGQETDADAVEEAKEGEHQDGAAETAITNEASAEESPADESSAQEPAAEAVPLPESKS